MRIFAAIATLVAIPLAAYIRGIDLSLGVFLLAFIILFPFALILSWALDSMFPRQKEERDHK